MPEVTFSGGSMLVGSPFKPGDQAPTGYLDWHAWAEIQHKAGLRQKVCGKCGLWRFPQEMSAETMRWTGKTAKGIAARGLSPICNKCAAAAKEKDKS